MLRFGLLALVFVSASAFAQIPLRQSTEREVRIGPAVAVGDGFTPVTTLDISAADEAELLKAAGAATVDISGATMAAITGADGWYDLTLTTSHTDTVGDLTVVINDDSLILPIYVRFTVLEESVYDKLYTSGATGRDGVIDYGTAQSATSTTLVLRSAAAFADGELRGATCLITGGSTGVGQSRVVTDNTGSTDTVTVDTWTTTPTGTITYECYGSAENTSIATILADTNELQTDWANGGRLDLILDARASQTSVNTIDDFVDSEVAAILANQGTPSDLGSGATIAGNLTDIEGQTDDIGVAGAGLTEAGGTGDQLTAADDAVITAIAALPTAAENATQLLGTQIEDDPATTFQQALCRWNTIMTGRSSWTGDTASAWSSPGGNDSVMSFTYSGNDRTGTTFIACD